MEGSPGSSFDGVGDALKGKDEVQEALKEYRDALAIRLALVARDDKNLNWQSSLAWSHMEVGEALTRVKNLSEGESELQAAIAIDQVVTRNAPLVAEWQNDLAMANERLGETFLAEGKETEALTSFRTAIDGTAKLLASDPRMRLRHRH